MSDGKVKVGHVHFDFGLTGNPPLLKGVNFGNNIIFFCILFHRVCCCLPHHINFYRNTKTPVASHVSKAVVARTVVIGYHFLSD